MATTNFSMGLQLEGDRSFKDGLQQISKRFDRLNQELGKTKKIKRMGDEFLQLEKQVGRNSTAIHQSRRRLSEIGTQLKNTSGNSKKYARALEKEHHQLKQLLHRQKTSKQRLSEVRKELRGAGQDTRNLTRDNKKLTDSIKQTERQLGSYAEKHKAIESTRDRRLQNSANMTFIGGGMVASGSWLTNKMSSPLTKAKQTAKSKGELQSVMVDDNGQIDKVGVQLVETKGKETAKLVAGLTTEVFTSSAYTIKSSMSKLSSEAVAEVTAMSAITAKATKSDLDTMTDLFGKGSGVYKAALFQEMGDKEFAGIFGSTVAASVQQFNTTGTKMANAIRSSGKNASLAGVSMAEQFAVLGQLQAVLGDSEAGTAYQAIYRNPAAVMEKLSKEGINVELINEQGKQKTMPEMLEEFELYFGKNLDATEQGLLGAAFGEEAMKALLNVWGTGDQISDNTTNIKANAGDGIGFSVSVMDNLQDNFSDRWDLQAQRWSLIQEQIGNALIPTIERLMPHLQSFADWLSEFITDNKGATAIVASLVGGLGVFLMTGGGLMLGIASLSGAAFTASAALQKLALNAALSGGGVGGGLASNGKKGKGKGLLGKVGGAAKSGLKGGGMLALATGSLALLDTWANDEKSTSEKVDQTTETVGGMAGAAAGGSSRGGIIFCSAISWYGIGWFIRWWHWLLFRY